MFPLHCNYCFKMRYNIPDLKLEITRCHHVICVNCKPKSGSGDRQCPVCKRSYHGVGISSEMPSSVANYFDDPSTFLELYRSISKFQSDQYTSYFVYHYKHLQDLPHLKRELEGYTKLGEQLRLKNDKIKKRIAEMEDYIDYHEKLNDSNFTNSSVLAGRRRPRTPSLSGTDSTLTDNEGDDFERLFSQTTSAKSRFKKSKKKARR